MMRRALFFSSFSLFFLFLVGFAVFVGACGRVAGDASPAMTLLADAGADAPFVPQVPTLLAAEPGSAFCGSAPCRMFVQDGQVFFESITFLEDGGAGITSAIVSVPVDGGSVTTVASTGRTFSFGPFASASGVEWLEPSGGFAGSATLYVSSGAGGSGSPLGTYVADGGTIPAFFSAADDTNSIYLASSVPYSSASLRPTGASSS
jgi:hypothetical protein